MTAHSNPCKPWSAGCSTTELLNPFVNHNSIPPEENPPLHYRLNPKRGEPGEPVYLPFIDNRIEPPKPRPKVQYLESVTTKPPAPATEKSLREAPPDAPSSTAFSLAQVAEVLNRQLTQPEQVSLASLANSEIPRPYQMMRELLHGKGQSILRHGETFYVYRTNHRLKGERVNGYIPMGHEEMESYLMKVFEREMPVLGTVEYLDRVIRCLAVYSNIQRDPDEVNPNLIALNDGIYDLRNDAFYPHSPAPAQFTPFRLLANFQSNQRSCPCFDRFLWENSGGDRLWISLVWQILGYCLTPDNSAKNFFLLQGLSNTGKSVLCRLLDAFFPGEVICSLDVSELNSTFGPSDLLGRQIMISPDLKPNAFNADAVTWIKRITGGDRITVNVKYRTNFISFISPAHIVMATNHPLLLTERDNALYQRVITVPFTHPVPPERQDKGLIDKLIAEKDAILFRALDAAKGLRQSNYCFSAYFPVNSPETLVQDESSLPFAIDYRSVIADLLTTDTVYAEGCFLPLSLLYDHGKGKVSGLQFKDVSRYCDSLLNPNRHPKTKRRYPGYQNPVYGYDNLTLAPDWHEGMHK